METTLYILFSIKTPHGYENYGQYFLGNDREGVNLLFEQLNGQSLDNSLLHMDLMETIDELPVRIKSIGCTLEDFAYNHRIIARDIFRRYNLDDLK